MTPEEIQKTIGTKQNGYSLSEESARLDIEEKDFLKSVRIYRFA
jgi:hypothetical protein